MKKLFLLLIGATFVLVALFFIYVYQNIPVFPSVKGKYESSEGLLLDRTGAILQTKRISFKGRRLPWTAFEEVSPAFWQLLIESEDKRFYKHCGIDFLALIHSLWQNIVEGKKRGASTITMQLTKFIPGLHLPENRFLRKLQQLLNAFFLEWKWNKKDILEAYANLVTFHGELSGISAASFAFYDKAPVALSRFEAAILIASLKSPNNSGKNIVKKAINSLVDKTFNINYSRIQERIDGKAYIAFKTNLAYHLGQRLLSKHSPVVKTTIDKELQSFIIETVGLELFKLQKQNVHDVSVVVIHNRSGEVRAYVGNTFVFSKSPFIDGAVTPRQAGSTLKPFLYATAFEKRLLTAASLIDDSEVHLTTPSGLYVPQDYDRTFKGTVTARIALAGSLNIPAVKTLMMVGPETFASFLKMAGFSTVTRQGEYYGYSLALGSLGVKLIELTNAYRAIANGGVYSKYTIVPDNTHMEKRRILSEAVSWLITDILSDNAARSITFDFSSVLSTPFFTAVKTGTSKDMRDNWCIGFSSDYTAGVWVGNLDNSPMQNVSGVSGSATIWAAIMKYIHRNIPSLKNSPPDGLVQKDVKWIPEFEFKKSEWFISGTETDEVRLPASNIQPEIIYPATSSTIAIDPDIPVHDQYIVFDVNTDRDDIYLELDSKITFNKKTERKWKPSAGKHILLLKDRSGNILDKSIFIVKG